MSILARILDAKRAEVARAKVERPEAELPPPPRPARSLAAALRRPAGAPIRAIAEVKRASPSAGPIRPGADPVAIAREYEDAGAAAVSVLTDREFFDGELRFLTAVAERVACPVLRKDFLVDPYQVAEARSAGADAVLVIVAAVDDALLAALVARARELDMDALVEAHDADEVHRAIAAGARIVGVNHRNLSDFTIDMSLAARMRTVVPPETILVAESGIRTAADVRRLAGAGADAILVGETLMRAPSPGAALRALLAGAGA
ncbi:MAG: indole-3-glycerol phosphate synthase TrpC [Deltaproteobacteria bacterium]|nr:MAG: indole-3-glycerol phosphate synthase TrpC [Deltaproteobacteria bacterium]